MGREIKRVARDFKWPMNKIWGGFLNPHYAHRAECSACKGSGHNLATEQIADDWTPEEPPSGEGWQMWETTSEGSPISPVFATAEDLAHWLAETGASSFGAMTATYEQWLAMGRSGWAPSAVAAPGVGLVSGVEAVAEKANGR